MGEVKMVDVSGKEETEREAVAECKLLTRPDVVEAIREGKVPKGDVVAVAKAAGILGSKWASQLIPLCHPVGFEFVGVDISLERGEVRVRSRVKGRERTGFEMEALFSAAVAALTIYDMCKGLDKGMVLTELRVVRKSGGKSGDLMRRKQR